MTVRQNIMFGPLVTGSMTESEAGARAMELIRMAGLKGYENAYPIHISSGMKRRVEILRALINEPKTLLLDEPYRAMDAITKSVMHQFLLDMFDRVHKTVLFITHDLDEAIYLSDKVGIMTTRPGRFKKWIHVDLPRPRTFRTKNCRNFSNTSARPSKPCGKRPGSPLNAANARARDLPALSDKAEEKPCRIQLGR